MSRHGSPTDLAIAVIANEPSGARIASEIITAIRETTPRDVSVLAGGIGQHHSSADLSFDPPRTSSLSGVTQIVSSVAMARRDLVSLSDQIIARRPNLLVTVDYPGMHLRLARRVRAAGIRTLHIGSPQIWAWRAGRVRQVIQAVDDLIVLYPFEVDLYRPHGQSVHFFGHPIVDRFRADRTRRERVSAEIRGEDERTIVAWMPGSRPAELRRHLAIVQAVAERTRTASYRHIVARGRNLENRLFPDYSGLIEYVDDAPALLEAADCAAVKIGTGTLEAALIGTPFLAFYKASAATAGIARLLSKTSFYAMPNILANEPVVTEFMQEDCSAEKLGTEIGRLVEVSSRRTLQQRLRATVDSLYRPDAIESMASLIIASAESESRYY